jgi:hypothetical protein
MMRQLLVAWQARLKTIQGRAAWRGNFWLLWEHPLSAALLTAVVYLAFVNFDRSRWWLSQTPYFNYLADAFLHGSLALLQSPPPISADLVFFNGSYFLYWPPFPALVMLPFVALFGPDVSDVLITLLLGAGNIALVALLLRLLVLRRIVSLTPTQRGVLVIATALGTVHTVLAPHGRVWFTAQIVAFGLSLLAAIVVLRWQGWLSAVLLGGLAGALLLTRNHMVFTTLWPLALFIQLHWGRTWRPRFGYALLLGAPLMLGLGALLLYNNARFGNPFENGLDYHLMAPLFAEDYTKYGPFHLHYLPTNLYYQYLFYPLPWREESWMGGSLFLMSPLFLAAFWAWGAPAPRWSLLALIASIGLTATPILLLMGTGWVQYGPRYTLDFTMPLLILTAMGVQRWPLPATAICACVSICHYLYGAAIFV